MNLLKLKNTITWEISPTSETKRQSDIFERCAYLSIKHLHTDQILCPLIVQDVSISLRMILNRKFKKEERKKKEDFPHLKNEYMLHYSKRWEAL